jgi:hypothetical protein
VSVRGPAMTREQEYLRQSLGADRVATTVVYALMRAGIECTAEAIRKAGGASGIRKLPRVGSEGEIRVRRYLNWYAKR